MLADPTLAPDGHSTLYVLVPVPNLRSGTDWASVAAAFRAKTLERLEVLGLHDIERRIRYERVITPAGWENEFAVNEGATFNLAHDLGQQLEVGAEVGGADIWGALLFRPADDAG